MWERFDWLQLFADGAADGGDAGEGQGAQSLEALGVPEEMAERHRRRLEKRQGSAAPEAAPKAREGAAWDAFFSDPAQKARLEQMMAERGRSATEAKAQAQKQSETLSRTLRLLGERLGLKPGEDGGYALEDVDRALKSRQAPPPASDADAQQADARARREAMLRRHFEGMQRQAEQLRELYPDFDLSRELENPDFFRRTAPGPGSMSVEDAFYSLHHREALQKQAEAIARQARQDAAASVRLSGARPRENGGGAAASVAAQADLSGMDRRDRLRYIRSKYPPAP